jgi:hypothetical protein
MKYNEVMEERNILLTINRRKANWIGHILRRNCLIGNAMKGKIKERTGMTGKRGRRYKKLLDDLKKSRGYCKLKEQALDGTVWRTRFGKGYEPFARQNTDD